MAAPSGEMENDNFLRFVTGLCETHQIFGDGSSCIDNESATNLIGKLKLVTDEMKNPGKRDLSIQTPLFTFLGKLLSKKFYINDAFTQEIKYGIYIETMRISRNACAVSISNQQALLQEQGFIDAVTDMLRGELCRENSHLYNETQIGKDFLSRSNLILTCSTFLLRCIIQFMGNFVSGAPVNAKKVWSSHFELFRLLMNIKDTRLKDYTCMLIYSCLNVCQEYIADLVSSDEGQKIVLSVISCLQSHDSQWSLFVIEKLLHNTDMLKKMWDSFEGEDKDLLLTIIENQIDTIRKDVKEDETLDTQKLPSNQVKFLCEQFVADAHKILGLSVTSTASDNEPHVIIKIMSVLVSVISKPETQNSCDIKEDSEVLKCSINLLHCMQMIGKEGGNVFTAHSKLSDAMEASGENPAFGVKRDLIRLLANLSHKHRPNQDMVREMGGISLILNHTNIDNRNPYITQWAILAMRNLCEDNQENQIFIAGMSLEGMADNLDVLRRHGVDAQLVDGKVVVKSLNRDSST